MPNFANEEESYANLVVDLRNFLILCAETREKFLEMRSDDARTVPTVESIDKISQAVKEYLEELRG